MHRIMHRVNTIEQLLNTPVDLGVEVDIRSQGKELIIQHEPFDQGESFQEWLSFFKHGILILNVKEEGLETHLLELMTQHGIEKFFFLDQVVEELQKKETSEITSTDIEHAVRRVGTEVMISPITDNLFLIHALNIALGILLFGIPFGLLWLL